MSSRSPVTRPTKLHPDQNDPTPSQAPGTILRVSGVNKPHNHDRSPAELVIRPVPPQHGTGRHPRTPRAHRHPRARIPRVRTIPGCSMQPAGGCVGMGLCGAASPRGRFTGVSGQARPEHDTARPGGVQSAEERRRLPREDAAPACSCNQPRRTAGYPHTQYLGTMVWCAGPGRNPSRSPSVDPSADPRVVADHDAGGSSIPDLDVFVKEKPIGSENRGDDPTFPAHHAPG